MDDLLSDISRIVFRRTVGSLKGKVTLTGKMLKVLIALDGQTHLREVSRKLNLSMSDMLPDLKKLLEYGVIEALEETDGALDPQFYGYLSGYLSRIAGPMAQVMVEDAILEIGDGSSEVPKERAGALIEMLGNQIPDERQRAAFVKNMLLKLREL